MYRCGKKAKIGDCVSIQVDVDTSLVQIAPRSIGLVLEINKNWSANTPLLTIKLANDEIQQLPSTWCTLCERRNEQI